MTDASGTGLGLYCGEQCSKSHFKSAPTIRAYMVYGKVGTLGTDSGVRFMSCLSFWCCRFFVEDVFDVVTFGTER